MYPSVRRCSYLFELLQRMQHSFVPDLLKVKGFDGWQGSLARCLTLGSNIDQSSRNEYA